MTSTTIHTITPSSASITLRGVAFTPELTVDEVTLDSTDLALTPGDDLRFSSGETRFRGFLTEANLNRLVAASLPADAPVKSVKATLYTDRAQLKGLFVKTIMSLPFTLEARPRVANGIRLSLDCSATQIGGIGLPGAAVDIIERVLNERLTIDLTEAAFPVRLDEVKCEPGRIVISGRARLCWPAQGNATCFIPPSESA